MTNLVLLFFSHGVLFCSLSTAENIAKNKLLNSRQRSINMLNVQFKNPGKKKKEKKNTSNEKPCITKKKSFKYQEKIFYFLRGGFFFLYMN